jgi:hypothetical protein
MTPNLIILSAEHLKLLSVRLFAAANNRRMDAPAMAK